jgi:hypothetical protein
MKKRPNANEDALFYFDAENNFTLEKPAPPPPPVRAPFQWAEVLPGLFRHGICEDKSDLRAHVSIANRSIYVFSTKDARETISRVYARWVTAADPDPRLRGVTTSQGYLVKPCDLQSLQVISFPDYSAWSAFNPQLDTSPKGTFAQTCVASLIRLGRFPLHVEITIESRRGPQLEGTDIILYASKRIQVKCDKDCGERRADTSATGNLYIEYAERNYLRKH